MNGEIKMAKDPVKVKAMERLIYLVRVKNSNKSSDQKFDSMMKMGFEDSAKELDKLKVPMWKQNWLSYLATNTNMYEKDIIDKLYYLKSPLGYNINQWVKK